MAVLGVNSRAASPLKKVEKVDFTVASVVQQDLPDPNEDDAKSAIETELRAFFLEAGGLRQITAVNTQHAQSTAKQSTNRAANTKTKTNVRNKTKTAMRHGLAHQTTATRHTNPDSRISERHHDFLYAFFACAVVASRRRARRWSSPPAPPPRARAAPAASTPHAHDAASFRNLAAPARTDD